MIKRHIPCRRLANGTQLSSPVFHFRGRHKGSPATYIQSGVHGAEVQGYWVSLLLVEHFAKTPPHADVTIVPLANPYATNIRMGDYTLGRFDPATGENWNRHYTDNTPLARDFLARYPEKKMEELVPLFKTAMQKHIRTQQGAATAYPKKLALELQRMALSADIVLDLHCDTHSVPHIYSPSYAVSSASALGIPYVVEVPPLFAGALDEAIFCPWIALAAEYKRLHAAWSSPPVEAFTIELGHQEHLDMQEAQRQTQGILHYLGTKGVCDAVSVHVPLHWYHCALKDFLTIYAPTGGIVIERAALGRLVKAERALMTLSSPHLFAATKDTAQLTKDTSVKISAARDAIPITYATSPIVHEGTALAKIFTNYQKRRRDIHSSGTGTAV